ncbi:MAG: flippase [Gemmatimonadaceae bacterium]|nr:flippase [Gemmatimonadaceae bacterium]
MVAPGAPSLLRSGALSLFTSAAPLVVALIALPLLTRHLGTERMGLLALAWAWLTYAALLDFGLGRTLTRLVAAADSGATLDAPLMAYVSTALVLLSVVGAAVGLLGALVAPWYVLRVLHVSPALRLDAVTSAVLFALTVPAITAASVPRAVLEARHRFRDVNLVRLPVSVGTFAIPLLLLPFTASLTVIAITLAVVRVWALWRYRRLAQAELANEEPHHAARGHLRPLLRAGAWMTVSNVLNPLLTVADRFLVGTLISVSAVALYAVPWEAVTKLFIVPGALTMVLFPALTGAWTSHREALVPLHTTSVRLITLLVVPACIVGCLLAPWLLELVGGTAYRGDSVAVLRVLAIGVAANCIAAIPFTMLQACGRARWTATVHLCEVIPFGALLWFGITRWGIVGAAAAWTIRAVADLTLMTAGAQLLAPLPTTSLLGTAGGVGLVTVSAWLGASLPSTHRAPIIIAVVVMCTVPWLLWSQRTAAERLVGDRVHGQG